MLYLKNNYKYSLINMNIYLDIIKHCGGIINLV